MLFLDPESSKHVSHTTILDASFACKAPTLETKPSSKGALTTMASASSSSVTILHGRWSNLQVDWTSMFAAIQILIGTGFGAASAPALEADAAAQDGAFDASAADREAITSTVVLTTSGSQASSYSRQARM